MAWKLVEDKKVLKVNRISGYDHGEITSGDTGNTFYDLDEKMPRCVGVDVPSPRTVTLVTHSRIRLYRDTKGYSLSLPERTILGDLHVSLVSADAEPTDIPRFHFEELFIFGRDRRLSLLKSKEQIDLGMLMNILNGARPHYIRGYSTPKSSQERTDFELKVPEARNAEVVKRLTSLYDTIQSDSDLYDIIRFLKAKRK